MDWLMAKEKKKTSNLFGEEVAERHGSCVFNLSYLP